MNWQPIETAPKDGSEIIVCEAGSPDIEFVRWNDFGGSDFGGGWMDRMYDPFEQATHWMPRPEPPIAAT